MFMHNYTLEEMKDVVWVFMARGYTTNANKCLLKLEQSGLITAAEAAFWWS